MSPARRLLRGITPASANSARIRGIAALAPGLDEFDHLLTKLRRVCRLRDMRFGRLGLLVDEQ